MPRRVQQRRAPGATIGDAVSVAAGSRWVNPFAVDSPGVPDPATAVELHAGMLAAYRPLREHARRLLRGRDLACYCKPDEPCHADTLLAVANARDEADL
jgi:hypothetical protein